MSISSPYYNRNIRLARTFGDDYTFEHIKTRIYQSAIYDRYFKNNDNEKVYKLKIYDGIKINTERLKTSSFYRLYVYYLYLLGKLPPKIHYEEITKEYYQELDKFHKLCDELNMIADYKLELKENVENLRTTFLNEVAPLKAEREKLRQLSKKTTTEADKTIIQAKIDIITEDINKINNKIQTCRKIIIKSEKGEKENWLIKKMLEDNRLKNEKENAKNKDKKRVR